MAIIQTIRGRERASGGYRVTIESTGVFASGTHTRQVFVPASAVDGKTLEEVKQAVYDAAQNDPIAQVVGATVTQPTATKEILTTRMLTAWQTWRAWKDHNVEAVAQGAGVSLGEQQGEDAAMAAFHTAIDAIVSASGGTSGIPRPNGIAS